MQNNNSNSSSGYFPPNITKDKQIAQIVRKQTKPLNEALDKKGRQTFGKCFMQNQHNPQRFAQCLSNAQQKIKKVQKALKYDGLFMTTTYQMCMTDKKLDKAQCNQQFKKLLISSQQKRLKQVQKI